MKEEIINHLKNIEKEYNVKVIYAVESGSRAWGFSSMDSDYDVRFIYVRKAKDYLSLVPYSDVIEYVLNDTLDINGWDLKKALKLLATSNPTLLEWLFSPIVYLEENEISELRILAKNYSMEQKLIHHYLHIAQNQYNQYILDQAQIRLKKYFYCIRPILCIEYIKRNHCIPPVLFDNLLSFLPKDMLLEVTKLLSLKKNAKEDLYINTIHPLNCYLSSKIKDNYVLFLDEKEFKNDLEALNEFFLRMVKRYDKI